ADLARLNLTPEEIEKLTGDMETIINYSMNKLNELNTDDVLP
ncbi:MAG TPA: Asp-tRNA(Asn)/Glu-tRNA(Gln) amidotransferase GatCAB subunit C, partial [Ruminiclostridium sp.]|nr:Asp-tRNA(Asn)/Glu-tRNA(Gln) amidotransferase GatCAB subunit C [Ruminiclostridium sp.]